MVHWLPLLGFACAPTSRPHHLPPLPSTRSAVTAGGETCQGVPCRMAPAVVVEQLQRYEAESPYVRELLASSFFPRMMEDDRLRRLFVRARSAAKEVTEAYAAARRVRLALEHLGCSAEAVESGRGVVLLDVCSGKGVASTVLAHLFCEAEVVMLDSNPAMQLAHVAAQPNVRFVQADLFSRDVRSLMVSEAARPVCVAIGMHLCGNLSPRLLLLAGHVGEIDALVLCPCCIKGSLGEQVKRCARRLDAPNYQVLVEALATIGAVECGEVCTLSVYYDEAMLTPKNGLITVVKHEQQRCGRREPSTDRTAAAIGRRPRRGYADFEGELMGNRGVARMLQQFRAL